MGYFLGIDVGAARTVAAVARPGTDAVETVDLGDGDGVGSVLHLAEDGTLTVGDAAQERGREEPDRVVEGFPGRIGDGEPLLLAGEPWAAEELTAWLVRWVVDRVAEREGGPAAAVAVTPPAGSAELLAAAVAEQDLDVRFPEPADDGPGDATALATALRDAAGAEPVAGDAIAALAEPVAGDAIAALAVPAASDDVPGAPDGPDESPGAADEPAAADDPAPDPDGWDVPAPRRPEPATAHLLADLVGFTGGMGATNTAGLLSGYTPPHGTPSAWSATPLATATAVDDPVALPDQRSGSGRWGAVAPALPAVGHDAGRPAPAPPLRPHQNPVVLVAGGGIAAALAVVGTLLLWPAPRTTDTAAVRPVSAVPVVVGPSVEPSFSPAPTAEPVVTHRPAPRPAAPRTRRPAAPPVTASAPETTPAPSASVEPSEPPASEPPSRSVPPTTTTTEEKDD